ncbi:MAG: hypothetical protein IPO22_02415 [Anaerolineales bacterium]|nr:hypothetical protein [Anaerolineales bacterium]
MRPTREHLDTTLKANQLLDEAGWVMGRVGGIRVAKGAMYAEDRTRLSLELQGVYGFRSAATHRKFIVENLKAIGVEAPSEL